MDKLDELNLMDGLPLKKYERQNIKRRLNCNPAEYLEAFQRQKGLCEMCQQLSKHFLKPDKFKVSKTMKLLCDFCLHLSELRKKNPSVLTDRMRSYLEIEEYNPMVGR